jgi:hypothetical protein
MCSFFVHSSDMYQLHVHLLQLLVHALDLFVAAAPALAPSNT